MFQSFLTFVNLSVTKDIFMNSLRGIVQLIAYLLDWNGSKNVLWTAFKQDPLEIFVWKMDSCVLVICQRNSIDLDPKRVFEEAATAVI